MVAHTVHVAHADDRGAAAYFPAAHTVQTAGDVATATVLYNPAAQPTQAVVQSSSGVLEAAAASCVSLNEAPGAHADPPDANTSSTLRGVYANPKSWRG